MKKLAQLLILAVALNSCVNEDYDLTKIDGTAVILNDLALPIGSLEKMTIEDIISFDEEGSMIKKESNGDLTFQFSGTDPFEESITLPSFSIPFSDELVTNKHIITLEAGPFAGMNGSLYDQKIGIDQSYEKAIEMDQTYLLPPEIIDIKYVEVDMVVDYNISVSSGAVYISKDFRLDFPDWMTIEKYDDLTCYTIEKQGNNSNIIRFTSDTKISAGTPIVLKIKIKKIELPEGSIVDGGTNKDGKACKKIWIEPEKIANKILEEGYVYMHSKDFPTIPETLNIEMTLQFSDIEVKAANVSLDLDLKIDGQTLPSIDYPDFLTGEDIVFDIYDAFLRFNVTNGLPLSLEIDADFATYKNSVLSQSVHLGAGVSNGTTPIVIPANSTDATITFSKLGTNGSIKVPQIGDILSNLPDQIKISDISVSCSQDYIDIRPGANYNCSLAYDLFAPLAFGEDFNFSYDLDINDIGLDMNEVGIKSASLVLDVINSIPLNLNVSAKALDKEGKPVEGMELKVLGDIASGVQSNPTTTHVEISLNSKDTGVNLDALSLTLSASGPDAKHLGTALNVKQGLKIEGISLRLPDGVTVDLTDIFQTDPASDRN